LLAKGNPIGRVRSRAARPRSSRTSHSVAPARYSRGWVGEHDHGELAMFGVGAHGSSPISFTKAQPKLQPALLRLSAMISQYFIGSLPFSSPDEFPTPHNLWVSFADLIGRRAHVRALA